MSTAVPIEILGIRTAPKQIRYALVRFEDGTATLMNAATESELRRPAQLEDDLPGHLRWVFDEVSRILRQHQGIGLLALKVPEFSGTMDSSSRLGGYLDGIVILAATIAGVPAVTRLYTQIATKRASVKSHAEARVGRTQTNWNEQMADAIAVAWHLGTIRK